ncbi:hypothetical protein BaRGS_00018591 [Batillaria attramentaria]|uniref:Uncharacterized protein n=1 Tax=Batillaria attramentaria TaxID=370345 RepID=A0ABD0KT44_9CAEN
MSTDLIFTLGWPRVPSGRGRTSHTIGSRPFLTVGWLCISIEDYTVHVQKDPRHVAVARCRRLDLGFVQVKVAVRKAPTPRTPFWSLSKLATGHLQTAGVVCCRAQSDPVSFTVLQNEALGTLDEVSNLIETFYALWDVLQRDVNSVG